MSERGWIGIRRKKRDPFEAPAPPAAPSIPSPTEQPWPEQGEYLRVPPSVVPPAPADANGKPRRPVCFFASIQCPICHSADTHLKGKNRWKPGMQYRVCQDCGVQFDAIDIRRTSRQPGG